LWCFAAKVDFPRKWLHLIAFYNGDYFVDGVAASGGAPSSSRIYHLSWRAGFPRYLCTRQWRKTMKVSKFTVADVALERSPGQEADIFVGNLVDERQGGPITIGYGRYAPGQSLTETIEVDDVMIVLEGRLSVSTDAGTVTAGPGAIVYMPKGEAVTIRSHEEGALTAYVTYPHWRPAHA
jgi:ethanolamine utilization protein EutQ (cupin superfamily)